MYGSCGHSGINGPNDVEITPKLKPWFHLGCLLLGGKDWLPSDLSPTARAGLHGELHLFRVMSCGFHPANLCDPRTGNVHRMEPATEDEHRISLGVFPRSWMSSQIYTE